MGIVAKIIGLANKGVTGLGIAALGVLPLIVFYDVTARYVFNAPTIWATEISIYLLQLLVFLPMGLLLGENSHIRSTLLTDKLSPRAQRALHLLSLAMVALLAGCITWLGWKLTAHSWHQSQVSATLLAIPLWLPNALIPLGGLLLLINALGGLISPPAEFK
ncbi:TRAP transporter small permease [Pollutimonas bauzanensis]|uniref:TRAP transporter small permease protein n=1 Tax=Pollutimonas bauzanensis TaxID=658167 RepID=A0A1M5Y876_9BURK|nr:TRAP transporter small permease [Pollutimonas bauzanensis]SHI07683.1 TRAP-type C4-dicarboxylate transport system, small permease component [Pollutimonas bauzanensis]